MSANLPVTRPRPGSATVIVWPVDERNVYVGSDDTSSPGACGSATPTSMARDTERRVVGLMSQARLAPIPHHRRQEEAIRRRQWAPIDTQRAGFERARGTVHRIGVRNQREVGAGRHRFLDADQAGTAELRRIRRRTAVRLTGCEAVTPVGEEDRIARWQRTRRGGETDHPSSGLWQVPQVRRLVPKSWTKSQPQIPRPHTSHGWGSLPRGIVTAFGKQRLT